MLVTLAIVLLCAIGGWALVLARRERAAARIARTTIHSAQRQIRDVEHRLAAVREEGRRQSEILASIDVARRLTVDPDSTTGPHGLVAIIPGRDALPPPRPTRKEQERELEHVGRSPIAPARRRSTAN